jgi:erythromycin esterase-like protein
MSAWSHLPNAHHVDRVLESAKLHPEIWESALTAPCNLAQWNARKVAWDAAKNAIRNAARDAARDAAMVVARDAARDAAKVAAMDAAWNATTALIAWDDASKYLDMPSKQLPVWAILSEDPAAVLLLPAVIAFERISELELA